MGLSERQRLILLHLQTDPVSVDHLIEQTALPAAIILQELTFLSLKGVIRRMDGNLYAKRSKLS
jgi:predicted Rossmann fold nucleotide-binding protein DprA/Smf involved in DNA uptake